MVWLLQGFFPCLGWQGVYQVDDDVIMLINPDSLVKIPLPRTDEMVMKLNLSLVTLKYTAPCRACSVFNVFTISAVILLIS